MSLQLKKEARDGAKKSADIDPATGGARFTNADSDALIDSHLAITLFIMSKMQSPGNNTTSSANRQFNCQFTSEQRSAIVAEVSSGKSYAQVAKEFNTTKSTVFAILKRWKTTQSVDPKPQKGRPQKLTASDCGSTSSFS